MEKTQRIKERSLYALWKEQSFPEHLRTYTDEPIEVLDAGEENIERSGPDFENARIRIGNLTYVGDVEIDCDYHDWFYHGHYIDKHYSKVILHITLRNYTANHFVTTCEGRKIPTISISKMINKELGEKLLSAQENIRNPLVGQIKCSMAASRIDDLIKRDILFNLGVERFKSKCHKLFHRLKSSLLYTIFQSTSRWLITI